MQPLGAALGAQPAPMSEEPSDHTDSPKAELSARARGTRKSIQLTGNFIKHNGQSPQDGNSSARRRCSNRLRKVVESVYIANFMALVVLIDAYCTCAVIDSRAAGHAPNLAVVVISDVCLALYTLELSLIFFVFSHWHVLKDWMMVLDVLIVGCGWFEIIVQNANITEIGLMGSIKVTRVLRLVRIFRLIRLLRRVRTLKELHKLATMMATCIRTLLWCFLLCFVVMTGWAMLIVEVVHPIMQEMMARDGTLFSSCEFCSGATSNVMSANLLLFKTVIAGDSWGEIAVPIITEHPATAIIFVGSQLTIVFGVVNLIVAVVVDTFAEARDNDVQNLAEEMEAEIQQDSKMLAKIFERIDKDGSGQLTLEDLVQGARTDAAFQSRLRVMDIDENDLQQLFRMIDADESGTIEAAEFIGPLSRWAHDSKTAPRFIKYNMLQTMHLQEDLIELSADCFNELSARLDDLSRQLPPLQAPGVAPGPIDPSGPSLQQAASTRQRVAEPADSGSALNSEAESEITQDLASDIVALKEDPEDEKLQQPNRSAKVPMFFAPKLEDCAETNRAQQMSLEFTLEETMRKLELKLDALLQDSKKIKVWAKYPRRSQRTPVPASRLRAATSSRPGLHPEAFRSMYLPRKNSRGAGGTRSGTPSEALHSLGLQDSAGPAFIKSFDNAAAAARFSKDRVWRNVLGSATHSNKLNEAASNDAGDQSWAAGSLGDLR